MELDNVAEYRFTVITLLCVLVAAGRAIDGLLDQLAHRSTRWTASGLSVLGGVLCAVLLVPNMVTVAPVVPLTTAPVTLPTWFRVVGARLPPGQVLLTYPAPFSGLQASQAWQAKNAMRWAQAGIGGPSGTRLRAGTSSAGWQLLSDASSLLAPSPQLTPARVDAVRAALGSWEVTMIVVPDQEHLGPGTRARSTSWAVGFFTTVMGSTPTRQPGAWVWRVAPALPAVSADLVQRFDGCQAHPAVSVDSMLGCLSAGRLVRS